MPRLFSLLIVFALTLPSIGQQEKLIGTWEYLPPPEEQDPGMVLRLEFKAGGLFEAKGQSISTAAQLFQAADQEQQEGAGKLLRAAGSAQEDTSAVLPGLPSLELEDEILAEFLAGIFPDTLTVSVAITGTWEADAERLRLDGQASQMRVNGLEPGAFLEQMARRMAEELAGALEIPAEDYPAFEAEIVEGFLEGTGDSLEGEFSPDEVDMEGTYVIEQGVLTVTDLEGEVSRFQQVVISGVAALSWGQLKAASR